TEVAAGEYGEQVEKLADEFALPLPVTSGVLDVGFKTAYGGQQMTKQVTFLVRFIAYIAFALMTVVTFYGVGRKASTVVNNAVLFFTIILVSAMQTMMPAVIIFPIELGVLLREKRNDWYTVNLYYLASYVNEIPFLITPFTIFLAIIYYPTGQPLEWWRAAAMLLFGIQLGAVMQSVGLMVGAFAQAQ
ncbi:ABC transporter, putative, partial [Ixodes scapularis]